MSTSTLFQAAMQPPAVFSAPAAARPSTPEPVWPSSPPFDVVSDLLHNVRLRGAVYFLVEASAPWAAEAPPARELAGYVMPGAAHVIEYHVVVSGTCWASLVGGAARQLSAGDVVLFPRGDGHVMSSAPGMRGPRDLPHRAGALVGRLPIRLDRTRRVGGDTVQLACGFLACDDHRFNPLLSALPRLLHVARSDRTSHAVLDALVHTALAESTAPSTGGEALLARLSELMFVEAVRNHLATVEPTELGWLSGLRDPVVGRALTALHARPADDWTLHRLARAAGASRSTLAQRFTQLVGMPPVQYLTHWRMQLCASLLASGATLAQIAGEVGYSSEAALSKAFKNVVGVSPADWRARHAAGRSEAEA